MTLRRLIRYDEMDYTRNPHPARGVDVLSLDLLRHYIRKLFTDPLYSIANVQGAEMAFIRACRFDPGYFRRLFVLDPPGSQFLSARSQRRISKQVLLMLRGKIHYETDMPNIRKAVAIYDPGGTPPAGVPPIIPEIKWRLQFSRLGPTFRRVI